MAAIFYDAVAETLPVLKIMNYATHPNVAFLILDGTNPGYGIGDKVTYVKGSESFSGDVVNTNVGGISASYPRGYYGVWVNTPDYQKFNGYTGGTLSPYQEPAWMVGGVDIRPTITNDGTSYTQVPVEAPVVSAAVINSSIADNGVIIKEDGDPVGSGAATADQDATGTPAGLNPIAPAPASASALPFGLTKQKAIMYGVVALAGLVIFKKLFK
jgi:hypothetical protein